MKVVVPVPVPPDAWVDLTRPEVLAAALPGCRSVSPVDGGGLRLVVDVAVASVRGLWAGTLTETGTNAWHLVGSGEPGRADLAVRVDDDHPNATVTVTVTVEGTVEGPLAAIGSTLLAAAVRRLVDDTLTRARAVNQGGAA